MIAGKVVATDLFFGSLDPASRRTATALRDLVRSAAPALREGLVMGVPHWTGNDYVCYIAVYANHVNLGFHHGAQLTDSSGLLVGTGKGLRHVKIQKGAELPKKQLMAILRKAIAYDRGAGRRRR